MTFAEELRAMSACEEAVAWVGDKTLARIVRSIISSPTSA